VAVGPAVPLAAHTSRAGSELGVDVLHEDPEGLATPVHLLVPLEVRLDEELYLEAGARYGQDVNGELELGDLVDVLVDELAELWRAY